MTAVSLPCQPPGRNCSTPPKPEAYRKEILGRVVKTSQVVTSQSQNSLPLVNLTPMLHGPLNCIENRQVY